MRSYEVARSLSSFLGFAAWSVVGFGVLAALAGAEKSVGFSGSSAGLIGAVPGIIIAVIGLLLVASVQSSRAQVDTAEYTQQMLKIARDQLEVSLQALARNAPASKGFADEKAKKSSSGGFQKSDFTQNPVSKAAFRDTPTSSDTLEHMGQKILITDGKFQFNSEVFETLELAKEYVERSHFIYEYKGMYIKSRDGKYVCNRKSFKTIEAAKEYVDDYNSIF